MNESERSLTLSDPGLVPSCPLCCVCWCAYLDDVAAHAVPDAAEHDGQESRWWAAVRQGFRPGMKWMLSCRCSVCYLACNAVVVMAAVMKAHFSVL